MTSSGPPPIRRAIATLTIVAFSIAALLGVVALLGGSFGDTEYRIVLTTVLVGVASIAMLCYLATAGTAYQGVGVTGGLVLLVPLVTGLLLIWDGSGAGEGTSKAFGIGVIAAATLAQACLLVVLADGEAAGIRLLLGLTLLVAGLLGLLLCALVLGATIGEVEIRIMGVLGILDVLGTVVVAALSKVGPGEERGIPVRLPERLRLELDGLSADNGRTRDEIVVAAVEEYLTSYVQKGHTG